MTVGLLVANRHLIMKFVCMCLVWDVLCVMCMCVVCMCLVWDVLCYVHVSCVGCVVCYVCVVCMCLVWDVLCVMCMCVVCMCLVWDVLCGMCCVLCVYADTMYCVMLHGCAVLPNLPQPEADCRVTPLGQDGQVTAQEHTSVSNGPLEVLRKWW